MCHIVSLIVKNLKELKGASAYYKRTAGRIASNDFKILKTVAVRRVSDIFAWFRFRYSRAIWCKLPAVFSNDFLKHRRPLKVARDRVGIVESWTSMLTIFLVGFVLLVSGGILVSLVNPLRWSKNLRVSVRIACIVVALLASYLAYRFNPAPASMVNVQTPYIDPNAPIEISSEYTARSFRLTPGAYQDFKWGLESVRIELIELTQAKIPNDMHFEPYAVDQAIIHVNYGGGIVYGGEQTSKVDINKYSVPEQIANEDEPRSIHFFRTHEKFLRFFRLVVNHINPTSKEVTLNAVFAETPR